MTLKSYLILMMFCDLVLWGVFGYIMTIVDPFATNWLGLALFYVSLFVALSGAFAVLGFVIRFVGLKKELAFHSVKTAFRQSFLFAFLIVAMLLLQAHDLFSWTNALFLAVALTLLEFFLLAQNRARFSKN
ncbi:MAG TPA: hypothetical protein VKO42_02820 [Patescibacteria group bacterium]|nr:hypothetical protein [Patescibacteria group bacterium]